MTLKRPRREAWRESREGPADGPGREDGLSQGPTHQLGGSKLKGPPQDSPRSLTRVSVIAGASSELTIIWGWGVIGRNQALRPPPDPQPRVKMLGAGVELCLPKGKFVKNSCLAPTPDLLS